MQKLSPNILNYQISPGFRAAPICKYCTIYILIFLLYFNPNILNYNKYNLYVFPLPTCDTLPVSLLTHCGRVTQICVFNTVKLGTSASSP